MSHDLGESTAGQTYRFGRRDYMVGRRYALRELPPDVRRDVLRQDDEIASRFGRDARTLYYRLILIPYAELVLDLKDRLGDERYARRLRSPEIRALARDIEDHGLQSPPVLEEGLKRALALAYLGWDMPYFTADEPLEMPDPRFIPTLDGRWQGGRFPLGR